MSNISDILRETSARAKAGDASFTAAAAPVPGGVKNLMLTYAIGTAVVDTVTGQNGVVVDGKRENIIIPAA